MKKKHKASICLFVLTLILVLAGDNSFFCRQASSDTSSNEHDYISILYRLDWQNFLSIDRLNDKQLWVTGIGGLLVCSPDNGHSWLKKESGILYEWLTGISLFPPLKGWVSGSDGSILMTGDGGSTWTKTTISGAELSDTVFLDTMSGCAVGRLGKVFVTNDGGQTWQRIQLNTSESFKAVCRRTSDSFFAVGSHGTGASSHDKGKTWELITIEKETMFFDVFFYNESIGWICGRNGRVFRTLDGGVSWENISPPTHQELNVVYFLTDSIGLVAGGAVQEQSAFFVTRNGGEEWFQWPDPLQKWWKSCTQFSEKSVVLAGHDTIATIDLSNLF